MESSVVQNAKPKMPIILILFCISTTLGFLYNLSTVLALNSSYQIFYAVYLIFPVFELIGVLKRSNRFLFIGFYCMLLFRIIEYSYAGFMYGFDRLFSTFGTNIVGYCLSFIIWWCYFYFSKKTAAYFSVSRTTSLRKSFKPISQSTFSESCAALDVPLDNSKNSTSISSLATQDSSNKVLSQPQTNIFSFLSPLHLTIVIVLAFVFVFLIIICLREHSLYQESIVQAQALSEKNLSLAAENETLITEISKLQEENRELQSSQDDSFVISMQFNYLKSQIRFILDAGTSLYHTYDCPIYQNYAGSYWIHNPEYCKSLGYHPCPICSNND